MVYDGPGLSSDGGGGHWALQLPPTVPTPAPYLCSNLRTFAAALLMLRAGDSEEEVYPKALEIAEEIVENCSPSSVTLSKFMLWKQLDVCGHDACGNA